MGMTLCFVYCSIMSHLAFLPWWGVTFVISTKYIPPPRRANWKVVDPTPRKKQVSFVESTRPSQKQTQQTVVHNIVKSNPRVPLSIGVKSTTGASKSMPKKDTQTNRSLLLSMCEEKE